MKKRILKKKAKKWMDEFSRMKIPMAFKTEIERKQYVIAWARMYARQKYHYPKPWWKEENDALL